MYKQIIRNQQTGEYYAPAFSYETGGFVPAWTAEAASAARWDRCGDDKRFDRGLKAQVERTVTHLRGLGFNVEAVQL